MQDLMNTVLLICAAIAALCLGVGLAFGFCKVGFAILRMHARSMTAQPPRVKTSVARV
jgi:hypothetical protein